MMDDCDRPMAIRYVMRRARKEHQCCECRRAIPIGVIYEYVSGIWDHQPSSYRTCALCADVRSVLVLLRAQRTMGTRRFDDGFDMPVFSRLYDYWEFATYPAHTGLKRRTPMVA